jgi:branched-chain amino acid transport system substrate-binding protein
LRVRWLAAIGCLLGVSALAAAGCGGGGGGGGTKAKGSTLTIWSSLPLQGANRPNSVDIIKGERLALQGTGNKGGSCKVRYKSLDDSTAQAGQWDPGQTSSNARKAAQDKSTIGYLGEFNSGASAISIPILSDAKIQQISPANTALELTKNPGPAGKGAPGKYYPSGYRNYARTVPADHIQGAAQGDWMKQLGVKKLYILNDKQVYGAGVAKTTADAAKLRGIKVLGNEGIDPKAPNYRSLASKIKSKGADAVFFGGIVENNGVQLFKDLGAALPNAKLFGPDGVAVSTFTKGLPADIQPRTYLTVATIKPTDYPPAGQKFFKDFQAKYGGGTPEPYAIYGYEAMSLLLDSMKRAGSKCNDRKAVRDEVFSTKDRHSVLGTYSIDKDGDSTLNDFGRYVVKNGKLTNLTRVKVKKDSFGRPLGAAAG